MGIIISTLQQGYQGKKCISVNTSKKGCKKKKKYAQQFATHAKKR